MKNMLCVLATMIIGFHAASGMSFAQAISQEIPREGRTRSVEAVEVTLKVGEAKKLIEERGEAAFAEFRRDGDRWLGSEQALFIIEATEGGEREGLFILYPSPEKVGEGALYMPMVNGKAFIRSARGKAKGEEEVGWFRLLDRFSGAEFHHASAVARAPNGKTYVVAAGTSNLQLQKFFIMELVNAACLFMEAEGERAFKRLGERGSLFEFKDSYVYVLNTRGKILLDPGLPQLEGKNATDLEIFRSAAAPDLVQALKAYQAGDYPDSPKRSWRNWLRVLKRYGHVWGVNLSRRPGDEKIAVKASYNRLIRAQKKEYIVGSGFYLADGP